MNRFLIKLPLRLIAEWLVIAGVYIISGQITPHISIPQGGGTPLWPPSAIALAAGLIVGYRAGVGVWLGSFLLNYHWVFSPAGPAVAAALATGSTVQLLVATSLIRKFVPDLCVQNQAQGDRRTPSTGRDILFFIGFTAVSSLLSPSVAVLSLKYAGFLGWNDLAPVWATWWVSDYAGILTLTPLLMVIVLTWRQRNVVEPIVFPLTTVWLGLSLVVSYIVWQNKTLAVVERLRQDTQAVASQFERGIEHAAEQMQAVEGLLIASENIKHQDFQKFVARLGADDKSRLVFQWVPRIKLEERGKFEALARRDGMPEFTVFERTALGQRVTAESRLQRASWRIQGRFGTGPRFDSRRFGGAEFGPRQRSLDGSTLHAVAAQEKPTTAGFSLQSGLPESNGRRFGGGAPGAFPRLYPDRNPGNDFSDNVFGCRRAAATRNLSL